MEHRFIWIILTVTIFVYAIVQITVISQNRMNLIENELSVILEEILNKKDDPSLYFEANLSKKLTNSCDNPIKSHKSMITQLQMLKSSIEIMKNEIDELRESSYQQANFALESTGAEIISIFDTKMENSCGMFFHFFINIWRCSHTPRNLIKNKPYPGECWMFNEFPGKVLIKLSAPVFIDSIAIQHIWDHEALQGLSDAPKEFKVYATNDDSGNNKTLVHLGTFMYDINANKSIQIFKLKKKTSLSYKYVLFEFITNNGNASHTCIYRVRVHGHM